MSFQMVALSKVAQPILRTIPVLPGTKYRTIGVRLWGEGAYERETIDGMQTAAKTLTLVKENDLIINKIWVRSGSAAVAPQKVDGCAASNEFPTFELDQTKIMSRWLHWMTKTKDFWQKCDMLSRGTSGKNRIRPELFLTIEIPLPPLEEQRRIVARIEELAAKIEEARELRREAVQEKENLLESSITKVFHTFRSVEKKSLKMLSSKIGSGSTPLGGRSGYASSGIPFIRSLNVRMRQFTWEGIAYIDDLTHENMRNTIVKQNDVLLNITGASIGRVACAPEDILEANVNQHVAIIRPIEHLQPRYLMYWLSQPAIQKVINSEQKGATRQGFTKSQIENFMVPFPSEKEQLSTISYLDEIQAQINLLERHQFETTAELNALLPSILDKAFKGEL